MTVVWRWNHRTGESYAVDPNDPPAKLRKSVQIMSAREAYKSPVTGERIYGRKGRSRDLAQHGCVDQRDVPSQESMRADALAKTDRAIEKAVDDAASTFE